MCAAGPVHVNEARSLPPNVTRRIRGHNFFTATTEMLRGTPRLRGGRVPSGACCCWVMPENLRWYGDLSRHDVRGRARFTLAVHERHVARHRGVEIFGGHVG